MKQRQNNHCFGNWGEDCAAKFLVENGYEVLTRNYRCKIGEIDIIAKNEEYIVFVEVKTRKNIAFGYPRESVTKYKQKKIHYVALNYITRYNLNSSFFRFDVVEIIGNEYGNTIQIFKNAFQI